MRSRLMAKSPKISASVSKVSVNGWRTGAGAQISAASGGRTMRTCILLLPAEHAAGTHDQNGEHEQVHQGQRQVLEIVGAEDLDEGDEHAADDGSEKASHPADD